VKVETDSPAAVTSFVAGFSVKGVCNDVEGYYTSRVTKYGATPLGVDWSCLATQRLRFVQLLRICDFRAAFSLNDVGCGYGALVDFVGERYPTAEMDYLGVDLSAAMIRRARRRHRARDGRRFVVGDASPRVADYSIASGIMNVKLHHSREQWERFVTHILSEMHRTSRRGFAVNFMAAASTDDSPSELYRTSPEPWQHYCRRELGCSVEVLAGYGMREFTLLARRGGGTAEPCAMVT
jgi:SAM-dependent methyltransferase